MRLLKKFPKHLPESVSAHEWDALFQVCSYAHLAVEDGELKSFSGGGLLELRVENIDRTKSKLALAHEAFGLTSKEALLRIIPRITDLGTNQPERETALDREIALLPAMRWLNSRREFEQCWVAFQRARFRPTVYLPRYKLIGLMAWQFRLYSLWRGHGSDIFPSTTHLDAMVGNIKRVLSGIDGKRWDIVASPEMAALSVAARKALDRLKQRRAEYKKPRGVDGAKRLQIEIFARSCLLQFEHCPVSMLKAFAEILSPDYCPDTKELKVIIAAEKKSAAMLRNLAEVSKP